MELIDDERFSLPDKAALLAMSGATTGKVSILSNPQNKKVYQNQRVGYFIKSNLINYSFLSMIVRSHLFKEQLFAVLVSGAQPNVSSKDIDAFDFMFPKSLEEQEKIGAFFENIDKLIILNQRKLEKSKAMKKAYLHEMFPAKGESKPKRRFNGFADDWKLCKIGEIGTVQTCKRIFKEQTNISGDIPFYKNGTLGLLADSYISKDVFEEFKKLYPFPEIGDILMSVVGSIGRTAEYKGDDEYFQDSNIVWLKTNKSKINRKFLKISYQIIDWIIEGSTIKHLYNDNILLSKIWLPSISEQEKIGIFFENLDNLITLHQSKLDKLKNLKKAYLNEMFI